MSDRLELVDGHLVVLGQTGLGKTALMRALIRHSHPVWPRVLIADKDAEYGPVAVGVQSVEEWAAYVGAGAGVPAPLRVDQQGASWKVAYQADDLDQAMPVLCEAVFEIAGGTLLVAEEADLWCSPAAILPEFAHLLKYGRKRGAWVCSVARRPSELHRLCTSQARHVIAFGTVEPIDVEYLRRAVSTACAEAVQTLEPLEAVWWDRRLRALQWLRVDPAALRVQRIDRQEPAAVG